MNDTDPVNPWYVEGYEDEAAEDTETHEAARPMEEDLLISIAASLATISNTLKSINTTLLSLVGTSKTGSAPTQADTTPPWLVKNKEKKPKPTIKRKGPPCPECEGPLVERHGPRGPFWGCANYPKCRGSRNMDQQEHPRDRTGDDITESPL